MSVKTKGRARREAKPSEEAALGNEGRTGVRKAESEARR